MHDQHGNNRSCARSPRLRHGLLAMYASLCLIMIVVHSAVAMERVELSTPVSRIGDGDGGLTASLQPAAEGGGTLEMTAWASPRLLGDYAQTNAVALLTDDRGVILQQAAFSCRRFVQKLAQRGNNACRNSYKVGRDALQHANYLFIFNTFCIWQEVNGTPTRVAGCVAEGDTVEQITAFVAQTLPGLVKNNPVAAGDVITAGDWRGARLR